MSTDYNANNRNYYFDREQLDNIYKCQLKESSAYCDALKTNPPCHYKPDFIRRDVKGALEIASLIARFVKDGGPSARVSITASMNDCTPIIRTWRYECCQESFLIINHSDRNHSVFVNHSTLVTDILNVFLLLQTSSLNFVPHELRFYVREKVQLDHFPVRHIDVSQLHVEMSDLLTRDQCSTTAYNTLCGDM